MKRRLLLALAPLLAAASLAYAEPQAAQPILATEKIAIITHDGTKHLFNLEMAVTEEEQETGLMFRTAVPADGGMIFDWGSPRDVPMWMENTLIPLDMVFVRADGTIGKIAENTVPMSLANIGSGGPVRATLELQSGITATLDIRVGDHVQGAMFAPIK
jgi:uncharacterized membrane protein (UPF0127 family)